MNTQFDFASKSIQLAEHLLRASRRRVLTPLQKQLRYLIAGYLAGREWPGAMIDRLLTSAYEQGVRYAVPMLPSAGAMAQVDDDIFDAGDLIISQLPNVPRTASDIKTALDESGSTADVESRALATSEYEISTAYHSGIMALSKAVSEQGTITQKKWSADPDACEECLSNAADGWIDEDALFATGVDSAPAHPNCKCSIDLREL